MPQSIEEIMALKDYHRGRIGKDGTRQRNVETIEDDGNYSI